jgi:translocation and assembly module TamB
VALRALEASVDGVDLAQLAPQALRTTLDVRVRGAGTPAGGLAGRVQGINRASGPLDQERLPLAGFAADFEAGSGQLVLRDATLDLGDQARAQGGAALRPGSIEARLEVQTLDLKRLHSALRSTALNGTVSIIRTPAGEQVELDLGQASLRVQAKAARSGDQLEVQALDARIANGSVAAKGQIALSGARTFNAQGRFTALDPAALGDFPSARLTGHAAANGRISPTWLATVTYALEGSRWRGQSLSGEGRFTLSPRRAHDVDARLALASNRLTLRGAFGASADRLQFNLQAPALSALRSDLAGALDANGSIGGTLQRPYLDAALAGRALSLPRGYRVQTLTAKGRIEPGDDPRVTASARADDLSLGGLVLASAQFDVEGARSAHRITARARRGALDLTTAFEGGLSAALDRWSGRVLALGLQGPEPVRLVAPAALAISRTRLTFGPAELAGAHGRLRIAESVLSEGRLSSSGSIESLPLARVLALLDAKSPVQTDLVLGARWSLNADRQINGRIELFRESGDIAALIDEQRFALGLEQLAADIRVEADRVSGTAVASGAHIALSAELQTRLERRGDRWGLAGTAPLSLAARAKIDSIKPIVALYTRAAEVDGAVSMTLDASGTVAQPRLTGSVEGSSLSVEQVGSGLYLSDGRLNASFERSRIRLEELTMQGGDGRLVARGEYDLERAALALDWTAERLTAVQRPDLLLVASGGGTVSATGKGARLHGKVRMDRGRVELREASTRTLGDDVVVVGRKPPGALPERVLGSEVDFTLELGEDFRVSGRGLDARVVGQVHLTTPGNAPLRAQGEIRVARGTYEVYGRKLDIDPGVLYFAGPLDNPALEIRAMRRNQAVEAGVEVSGTARNLEVRLVSVPEVPEMEKLSWLTLGRKLDTANQSETEQMQRYGAALATTIGTGSFQARVARAVGLDEITVLPGTDASGEGGIVQLGKRVGDRIYLILEQRLSTAENIFKVNYQLTRNWSLRLESGETDALDIFYTLSFD